MILGGLSINFIPLLILGILACLFGIVASVAVIGHVIHHWDDEPGRMP